MRLKGLWAVLAAGLMFAGAVQAADTLTLRIDGEPTADTYYRDADGDGYGDTNISSQSYDSVPGYVSDDSDCNDHNPHINPGAVEVCNGADDDCNGYVDDGADCDRDKTASEPDSGDSVNKIEYYYDYASGYNPSVAAGTVSVPSVGYSTIQSAIDKASPGDTVLVASGIYTENLIFSTAKRIVVRGSGASTILDGQMKGPVVTFKFGVNQNTVLDGFVIRNGKGGIIALTGTAPLIINNIIYSNAATLGSGILCSNASPKIVNNTIVSNFTIFSNSAITSRGGIGCITSSFPSIINTIVWDNGRAEVVKDSTSTPLISFSTIKGTSPGGDSIFSSNPLFSNTALRDYHLASNSPCIGKGTDTDAPPDDIDRNDRPQGSKVDIGADEFITTVEADENVTSNDDDGGDDGKCFIATAAFGTPMAEEVQVLRRFRNTYLLSNSWGRKFVNLYYRLSPPVADYIERHEYLRAAVRVMLRPLIWLAQLFL